MLRKREKAHKQEESADFNPAVNRFFVFFNFLFVILFLSIVASFQEYVFALEINSLQNIEPKIQKDPSNTSEALKRLGSTQSIDRLEDKIFHQNFKSESTEDRTTRLEEFIFGAKFENESLENRLIKLTNAIKPENKEQSKNLKPIQAESVQPPEKPVIEEPKIVYDESSSQGIIGAINQIEMKVFNKTFNEILFTKRIETLEDNLLTKSETFLNRRKSLMERVSYLVKKTELSLNQPSQNATNNTNKQLPYNYIINPSNGFLVNEQTGQVVIDSYGNPIMVQLPRQGIIPQAQYENLPTQNAPEGQFPFDLFLKQGELDLGDSGTEY